MTRTQRVWFRFVSFLASIGNLTAPKTVEEFVRSAPVCGDIVYIWPPCPRGFPVRLLSGDRAFISIEIEPFTFLHEPSISSLFQHLHQHWQPEPLQALFKTTRIIGKEVVSFAGEFTRISMDLLRATTLGPAQLRSLRGDRAPKRKRRGRTVKK